MNKYLITVTKNITIKKVPNVYFLFPLKDYTVGYNDTYTIEEINLYQNSYIYINRLLNTTEILNLSKIISNISKNIIGIVFEDLGIYELIKDLPLEKILYATHACCSYQTINTYLEYFDSVFISPDITQEETIKIINKASKPIIIYGLGHLPYMYSRRTLNTNYQTHFNLPLKKIETITEPITNHSFITFENQYGTIIYDKRLYIANNFNNQNIKYIFLNPNLTNYTLEETLKTYHQNNNETTTGFLNQKTTYQLK